MHDVERVKMARKVGFGVLAGVGIATLGYLTYRHIKMNEEKC